jgi:transcriptional regulator with XRE-family HTH domain
MTDKRYREEYAIAMLKRMIPYQVRAIRKKRGWSQGHLAESAKLTQGVISRAEDPNYGNLTLTTIGRIAAGYDLAAIVKFVPFTELVDYSENISEREFANLRTFEQENQEAQQTPRTDHGTGALLAMATAAGAGISTLVPPTARPVERLSATHKSGVRRESTKRRRGRSLKVSEDEQITQRSYRHATGTNTTRPELGINESGYIPFADPGIHCGIQAGRGF